MNSQNPLQINKFLVSNLLILSMLIACMFSFKCKKLGDMPESDNLFIKEMFKLNTGETGLLSSDNFGKVYIFPADTSKVVKIEILNEENEESLVELDNSKFFSDKDLESKDNLRFAPKIYQSYCVNMTDNRKLVIIVMERFRGDLSKAIEDPAFNLAMADFSTRMKFYAQLIETFNQIPKLKFKHCNLKPQNILYLEQNSDWNSDYPKQNTSYSYFTVISDFDYAVPWDDFCMAASARYTDHQDYQNEMKILDKDKEKVEMSSIALIILYLETKLITRQNSVNSLDGPLARAFGALGECSESLFAATDSRRPLLSMSIQDMFDRFLQLHKDWNNGLLKMDYNHTKLKFDIGYIISGLEILVEYLLVKQGGDENEILNLISQYSIFGNVLLSMVNKNNPIIDPRADNETVLAIFNKISKNSKDIEEKIQRTSLRLI